MEKYQPTAKIVYGLSNEEYRSAEGDSASVLKGCCDKSATHALTPKKKTKEMNTGLNLHEYILERNKFLSTYGSGLNQEDYPDALDSLEDLKAEVDKINENRLPLLKTTGSKDALFKIITNDSEEHFKNVQDIEKLSVDDLKEKINFLNKASNRGLARKLTSTIDIYLELVKFGWKGQCWKYLDKMYNNMVSQAGFTVLPYDEYSKYDLMFNSMMVFLHESAQAEIATNAEQEAEDKQYIMQWLHFGFKNGAMTNEVSMFGKEDKCRFDSLIPTTDKHIGLDLKKAKDASPQAFAKAVYGLHYDLQVDHYTEVAEECGMPLENFVLIAIEDYPPYACAVYVADDAMYESGNKKRLFAKKRLQDKRTSGIVSAYKPEAKTLPMPTWNDYGEWNE